jgi:hypothetical protein
MGTGLSDETLSTDRSKSLKSYRIPCRNDIAQKDERGINHLQGEILVAAANAGPTAVAELGWD